MPLGQRTDYRDARFCGVSLSGTPWTPEDVEVSRAAGFDFAAGPLAGKAQPRAAGNDLYSSLHGLHVTEPLTSPQSFAVGVLSTWIHLDASDPDVRRNSLAAFQQEITWGKFVGVQAVLLPQPPSWDAFSGYAQALQCMLHSLSCMGLWICLPVTAEAESNDRMWKWWHGVRTMCNYNPLLGICLVAQNTSDQGHAGWQRWLAEPVRALKLPTHIFMQNKGGFPVLNKEHQALVTSIWSHGLQVMVDLPEALSNLPLAPAPSADPTPSEATATAKTSFRPDSALSILKAHFEYLAYLFSKLPKLTGLDLTEFEFRDHLQVPLQPLADNLESATYETFELDKPKYTYYREAIMQALHDRSVAAVAAQERAEAPTEAVTQHVFILGAGRGPLVQATLEAADSLGCAVSLTALEKNPCAVALLRVRQRSPAWSQRVRIVACDMRTWQPEHKADIIVSELLGSFGDNELSPECLDGAQHVLKADGVSIPSTSTSYIAPISTHLLHGAILHSEKPARFEMPLVCKLTRHKLLAEPQPVFTFEHPNSCDPPIDNSRFGTFAFANSAESSAALHGFAGYFEATLYKQVRLSTVPCSHTPDMHSWFPMFFPLRAPLYLQPGQTISLSMWRARRASKVWYEWAVTAPCPTAIHNAQGRHFSISLDADMEIRNVL